PGGTLIVLISCEKIKIKRRVVEFPFAGLAELEYASEQVLRIFPLDENILARRPLIAESRGDGCPLHPQLHGIVEELGDILRSFALEQGAVYRDPEAFLQCDLYGFDGTVENAVLADRSIMPLLQTVQMNGESQIRRRC